MSGGPNDATKLQQTGLPTVSKSKKTEVTGEPQTESSSEILDNNKTTEIEIIESTNSIERQNPENEDAITPESQKIHTEMEASVIAIVNAEMQNPDMAMSESLVGIVSIEADFARMIIETFKGDLVRTLGEHYFDETFKNNAWELSLPADSETDMHFVKELGIDIDALGSEVVDDRLVRGFVKVTLMYQ